MGDSSRLKAVQPVLRKHGTYVELVVDLHGPVVQALEHLLRKAAVGTDTVQYRADRKRFGYVQTARTAVATQSKGMTQPRELRVKGG